MELKEKVRQSKTLFFELSHTLFSVISTKNAVRTEDILGIPNEIWTQMLFESSDERLRGIEKDKYEITWKLAHQYNPEIPEDIIQKAADSRL